MCIIWDILEITGKLPERLTSVEVLLCMNRHMLESENLGHVLGIVKSHTGNLCFILAGEDFKRAPGLGSGPLLKVAASIPSQLRPPLQG